MFLSKLQNSSRSPEVSLAEPWGSVRSTLRTYALSEATSVNSALSGCTTNTQATCVTVAIVSRVFFLNCRWSGETGCGGRRVHADGNHIGATRCVTETAWIARRWRRNNECHSHAHCFLYSIRSKLSVHTWYKVLPAPKRLVSSFSLFFFRPAGIDIKQWQ